MQTLEASILPGDLFSTRTLRVRCLQGKSSGDTVGEWGNSAAEG